jgi:hypothetical protein
MFLIIKKTENLRAYARGEHLEKEMVRLLEKLLKTSQENLVQKTIENLRRLCAEII